MTAQREIGKFWSRSFILLYCVWATELISQKTWRRTVTSSLCLRFVLELIHFALKEYCDNQIQNSYVKWLQLVAVLCLSRRSNLLYNNRRNFAFWKGQGRIRQYTFQEEFLLVARAEITKTNTLSEKGLYKTSKNVDSTRAQGYMTGLRTDQCHRSFQAKIRGCSADASYARQSGSYRSKSAYLRMWWSEMKYKAVLSCEPCARLGQF